jgi:hypothetical protein
MENLKEQLQDSIQRYFEASNIDEKASVGIIVKSAGTLVVDVYTKALLPLDQLNTINGMVYMLLPFGIMHEVVNVLLPDNAVLLEGPADTQLTMPERTTVVSVINQNGSQVTENPGRRKRDKE